MACFATIYFINLYWKRAMDKKTKIAIILHITVYHFFIFLSVITYSKIMKVIKYKSVHQYSYKQFVEIKNN